MQAKPTQTYMKISAVSMPFIVPQFPVKRLAGKFLKKVENSFPLWIWGRGLTETLLTFLVE